MKPTGTHLEAELIRHTIIKLHMLLAGGAFFAKEAVIGSKEHAHAIAAEMYLGQKPGDILTPVARCHVKKICRLIGGIPGIIETEEDFTKFIEVAHQCADSLDEVLQNARKSAAWDTHSSRNRLRHHFRNNTILHQHRGHSNPRQNARTLIKV